VRYCLLGVLIGRNQKTKDLLEQLILDKNESVSSQALERYMGNYVNVNKKLAIDNIEKLRPIPVGMNFKKIPDIRSVSFYLTMLDQDINNPSNGRYIMFVGLLGGQKEIEEIKKYMQSSNDYILLETVKALIRLGDNQDALVIIKELLLKNIKEHLYYQTETLYILAELDRAAFENEYRKIRKLIDEDLSIQPNWLNDHFLQGLEFNISSGQKSSE